MKILHTVEFYHPSVGGMQEVVKQISERLARLGHDVTVATGKLPERKEKVINGVKIAGFRISGNAVRGFAGKTYKYTEFLLDSDFDVITNFAAQQWATDLALPILERLKAKKVFVPTGFSGLYWPEYQDYFRSMKTWLAKYDCNVFLSNDYRDINFARENGIANLTVIPNGAGADEFLAPAATNIREVLDIPKEHFLLLHVGSHTGSKGHAEAARIFEHAKITETTFLLVGNSFGGGCTESCEAAEASFNQSALRVKDGKRLMVRNLTRQETVAAFRQADLFLFPSSIECSPLVLFECMAAKTPFLSSDAGNSAEIIEWCKSGKLLSTVKEPGGSSRVRVRDAVKLLEELYYHPAEREQMAAAGFEAWQKRFTWEKISSDYEKLYLSLVEQTAMASVKQAQGGNFYARDYSPHPPCWRRQSISV